MSDCLAGRVRRHSVIMREILLIFSPEDGERRRAKGRNPVVASSAASVFTAHFHPPHAPTKGEFASDFQSKEDLSTERH